MKRIFKKAVTVLGSLAMVGATVGFAAAASFPEPFTSNTAVVVGNGAATSDSSAAAEVLSALKEAASKKSVSGKTTLSGEGDKFQFKKSSTLFHMGDTISSFYSQIDDGELPTLLKDETYSDTDNNEFDYTQKITIDSGVQLTMFEDSDYKEDEPTVGFRIPAGKTVLTYTLDFSDKPTMSNMENTDITIMGKDYYILDVSSTNDKITLLDSADTTLLAEGESKTITIGDKSYEVSIEFINSNEVKLKINGETTKSISEGGTYKLKSGEYVGIKDILYSSKDTGVSKVEFSIGSGKLVLEDGNDVEMNDETIDGLTVGITNSSNKLDKITLTWNADDDLFITEDQEIEMPGFKTVKLIFTGLNYPAEEEIKVEVDSDYAKLENFPTIDSVYEIPLLYTNGSAYTLIGKDSDKMLLTSGGNSITFNASKHEMFIASYDDGDDGESYILKAGSFGDTDGVNKTTIYERKGDSWDSVETVQENDTIELGNVELKIGAINKRQKTVVIYNNSAETNFYELFSKEGLKIYLPHNDSSSTSGYINLSAAPTSWDLIFEEEDKSENVGGGDTFNVTLGLNSHTPNKEPTVSDVNGEEETFREIGDTDKYRSFMRSALATELIWDKSSSDQYTFKAIYHGSEVGAGVYIAAPSLGLSSGEETGIISVKDTESDKYAGKNLVVIGGSAINSVAADLLGGNYHGKEFEAKTGVGPGKFLIASYDKGGKRALLVAGYTGDDTTKAVKYLVNNQDKVDTSVGKKYIGESATEAKLVTSE